MNLKSLSTTVIGASALLVCAPGCTTGHAHPSHSITRPHIHAGHAIFMAPACTFEQYAPSEDESNDEIIAAVVRLGTDDIGHLAARSAAVDPKTERVDLR